MPTDSTGNADRCLAVKANAFYQNLGRCPMTFKNYWKSQMRKGYWDAETESMTTLSCRQEWWRRRESNLSPCTTGADLRGLDPNVTHPFYHLKLIQ